MLGLITPAFDWLEGRLLLPWVPPLALFVIACALNLYVSTNEIPSNQYTDNTADLTDTLDAYENGWNPWQPRGQSYSSLVVGFIAPSAAKLFHIPVTDVYRYILPIIYSLTPVLLYFLYRKFTEPGIAFIGALFFAILPPSYQEIPTRGKSEVAEPLAVAALLTLFSSARESHKILLSCLFAVLAVWCHYSVGIILICWLFAMLVMSKQRTTIAIVALAGTAFFFAYYHFSCGGELLNQLFHWSALNDHRDPIKEVLLMGNNAPLATNLATVPDTPVPVAPVPVAPTAPLATTPATAPPAVPAPSSPVTMLALPYAPVLASTNIAYLWLVRVAVYIPVALIVAGAVHFVLHHEWVEKYREYAMFLLSSLAMVLCALFIPFFTKGLYISAWVQFAAMSAGLLYGLSAKYVPKWVAYAPLILLLVVSVSKY